MLNSRLGLIRIKKAIPDINWNGFFNLTAL